MEQNALYNSEKGSEVEGPGSTSSLSNIGDQNGCTSSPVPSFTTSSSRHTKSSYERHSHRTGSPPVRDSAGPSSRQHNEHSTSPFDTLESLEAQTMSNSASKFSDFSAEPDYSAPPLKSAPPVAVHPHMSYKDAFNACLSSQQMSNSLTPYSQQQIPSQPGHLDKLSMDVLYHTQQSGASLSGISSIVPQLLQAKGGKPYLGKVHLKELDGDEIDLEKQRIKLMFYEKKNEERTLCEEEESSPTQEAGTVSPQKAFTSSSPPNAHQPHTDLEEERGNVLFDGDGEIPETRDLLQELETLEHMAAEQRRRCKELKYARERESLNLKKAEVEFQEQELLEPAAGGAMSTSIIHQERWQKEQKKRLRQLERFRAEQKDRMQKIEAEEHRAKNKLKAFETNIHDIKQRLEALVNELSICPSSESHAQPYHSDVLPSQLNMVEGPSSRTNGISFTNFTDEFELQDDQFFRPTIDSDQGMPPEREWPKDTSAKPNQGQFISTESINSSSLVGGNEPPDFSREIVNTISESTNMTEPTQDEPVPSRWTSKYVPNSTDQYAAEFLSKYSYSDDEFFMDDRRTKLEPEIPIDTHPFNSTSEKDLQRSPHHLDHLSTGLPVTTHTTGYHNHRGINGGSAVDHPLNKESEALRSQQWGPRRNKPPPPPVSDKPQNYTSVRAGHHYSRSNRPRMHNRNQPNSNDNMGSVSGVSIASSHTNADFLNSMTPAPTPDVVPVTHSSSPTASKIPSPSSKSPAQRTRETNNSPLSRITDQDSVPHSPSYLAPTPYSPYGEHPSPHPPYSVPSTGTSSNGPTVYDVPRKSRNKPLMWVSAAAIYDQPKPIPSSPKHQTNHVTTPLPSTSSSPQPSYGSNEPNRSPYHAKPHEHTNHFSSHDQHYDVPKPVQDQNRPTIISSDRDIARQTATNAAAHPYQYHGLPTKPPAPRSYSRGRLEALGYPADRGFRGQVTRPMHPQRVQRQQTEL